MAPQDARQVLSSPFIRREAARAAEDAEHARVVAKRFALLRTRVLREMRNRDWKTLAVVPLTLGAGGSFVSVNLALALARQPHTHVVLADMDLARPSIAGQLGIPGCDPISAALAAGRALDELAPVIEEVPNLRVIAPAQAEDEAAEILQDEALAAGMARLARNSATHALVLMDMAPLLGEDEALAALPLADALLLVADGRRGTAADMVQAERLLVGMPPVMGIILNKSDD
ncbi:chromosome partitioning protein [Paracoccus limosus]|uniref:Chromosome partitioning protein n=1 Tax=Paracoccus limosus TaxID=913252 RepID=A0A844H7A7_9RHOB|nr:chromosome partitioning protein [Paracoccus limosus]